MTTTQEKLPQIKIPNLGGLITEDDLYYKGKVPYCSWAKTAQRIRAVSYTHLTLPTRS